MAGPDRGLQAVPRGLERNLATYLQAVRAELLKLSGLVRGSDKTRALRASEAVSAFGTVSAASGGVDVGTLAAQILREGVVTEKQLADGAATDVKLADNAVTPRALAPGAVGNRALAEGAVTGGKLARGAVTSEALSARCVTGENVAARAVDTRHLAEGAVTGEKLAQGAVTHAALADGSVDASKLVPGAVDTDFLRDGSVTAGKLAKGALPLWEAGRAADGERVALPGVWQERPHVFLSAVFRLASGGAGEMLAGPEGLAEDTDGNGTGTGVWSFVARGDFAWIAVGMKRA